MRDMKVRRVGLALTLAERQALETLAERMGLSLSATMVVALRTIAEAMGVPIGGADIEAEPEAVSGENPI